MKKLILCLTLFSSLTSHAAILGHPFIPSDETGTNAVPAQYGSTSGTNDTNFTFAGNITVPGLATANSVSVGTLNSTFANTGSIVLTNSAEFPVVTLSYSAVTNLVIDCNAGSVFQATLTGTSYIAVPTNIPVNIRTIYLFLAQDGTGGWSVSFAGNFKPSGGVALNVTTNANAKTLITIIRSPFISTNFVVNMTPDFR